MKSLYVISFILFSVGAIHAVEAPKGSGYSKQDFIDSAKPYSKGQRNVAAAVSNVNFVFDGFLTQLNLFVIGGSATWNTNWVVNDSSKTIISTQSYVLDFEIPPSSPTVINFNLNPGTNLNVVGNGLKTDIP